MVNVIDDEMPPRDPNWWLVFLLLAIVVVSTSKAARANHDEVVSKFIHSDRVK